MKNTFRNVVTVISESVVAEPKGSILGHINQSLGNFVEAKINTSEFAIDLCEGVEISPESVSSILSDVASQKPGGSTAWADVEKEIFDAVTGRRAINAESVSKMQISKSARHGRQGWLYGITKTERAHVRSGGIVVVRAAGNKFWFVHASIFNGVRLKALVSHAGNEYCQLFEAEIRGRAMAIASSLTGNTEEPVAPVGRRRMTQI